MDYENCITRPEDDSKCPQATQPRDGTIEEEEPEPEPEPEIQQMNAMIGNTLDLECEGGCSEDVQWESRPGLNEDRKNSNRFTVNPVTAETAGHWNCRCGERRYVKVVKTCSMTWSDCRQDGGRWITEGTNSCTGTSFHSCTPKREEENSSEQDEAVTDSSPVESYDNEIKTNKDVADPHVPQARKEGRDEEASCTGSKCGFCNRNSLICGAIGCFGGAMTVIAAVFVRKSLQWRREAKEFRSSSGGTMETHLTATHSFSRQTADRNHLDYERALQIEDLVSRVATQRKDSNLSCSTSATNTLNLRHLREHDQLGRIQSKELQSTDNIACQRFEDSEVLINHFAGAHPGEEGMVYQEDPVQWKRSTLTSTMERPRLEDAARHRDGTLTSTMERPRFEDAARHRDGTLFDKYYDQDVDRWSIQEEVEI